MASYFGSEMKLYLFCEYVNGGMRIPQHACVGQRTTFSGQVSPAIMWDPEI